MPKLPSLSGKQLVRLLESIGFQNVRTKGSHIRMKSEDGRVTTIPVHAKREIPKGLLRKIIREDLELTLDEFVILFNKKN